MWVKIVLAGSFVEDTNGLRRSKISWSVLPSPTQHISALWLGWMLGLPHAHGYKGVYMSSTPLCWVLVLSLEDGSIPFPVPPCGPCGLSSWGRRWSFLGDTEPLWALLLSNGSWPWYWLRDPPNLCPSRETLGPPPSSTPTSFAYLRALQVMSCGEKAPLYLLTLMVAAVCRICVHPGMEGKP